VEQGKPEPGFHNGRNRPDPDAGPSIPLSIETEQPFRALAAAVREYAIFVLDPDGTVRSWNAGAERIKGYRPEEIIGRHFSAFYSPEDVAAGKPERMLARAAEAGTCVDEGWRVRKDGTRFWASVVMAAHRATDGHLRGFTKVTRDETESRAVQQFTTALRALVDGQDPDRVLDMIARQSCELLGAGQAWILTQRGEESSLELRAAQALDDPARLPTVGTVVAHDLRLPRPALVTDLAELVPELADAQEVGPGLITPLATGQGTRGVLVVAHASGGPAFRDGDLDLAEVLANQASLVLEFQRAQLELADREVLKDRDRIAQDINDSVIRDLFGTSMSVHGTAMRMTDPAIRTHLDDAVSRLDSAIRQLQTTVFDLRTTPQPFLDLGDQVFALTDKVANTLDLEPQIVFEGPLNTVSRPHTEHVLAVLREVLGSMVCQLGITTAKIELLVKDGLTLRVSHDGPSTLSAANLHTITEHAHQLGGSTDVDGESATTTLTWRIPLPR
jgi:PAS domain S-box-containing protein